MTDRWPFETEVRELAGLLVLGDYEAVIRRSAGARLSAEALASAVAEYGRRLAFAPRDAEPPLDVVPHAAGAGWSVQVHLWTLEEGRSDLTLELTVLADAGTPYRIEVDNLHVP